MALFEEVGSFNKQLSGVETGNRIRVPVTDVVTEGMHSMI